MPASESAETLLPVVSVRDLKPDDKNPNKGTKRGSQLIEKSLQSYGFGRSIVVDKNNKIIAGNKTQENLVQLGMTEEPIIVDTDGRRPIIHRRVDLDLDSDPRARELSLADNRTNQLSLAWDAQVLALLKDDGINLKEFWTEEELEEVLSEEGADSMMAPSDGSLLELVKVSIKEPRHKVERGEIYKLGTHILCCVEVMKEWPIWKPFLKTENHLFIPYPGPYAPLTLRAERSPLVMVQPDTYIAGHVIDRWCDVNGEDKVSKVT